MSAGPGNADERRQRLRDQMKAFYGDPNASTKRAASQATQGNPNVPPELDLDSEYFNVNRYTTDLLRRESLKGLVETDTELLRRVRRLDGELQELVYRNYARFISATDTIREMKDNVVEMDAKLQTLSQNVNTIDGISSQISQQLQVHRGHIEDTITANRMLKKVQFLTSLPTSMRRLIDKEEYSVGVKYWVAGDGFLTKHKSLASITQIQQQCCTLAKELYGAIEQRMCSYPLDDPDAMDRIRGYVEDLRLLRATSLFESAHMADQGPFEEAVLHTLMKSVTASFQTNVAATQRSLKAALVIPDDIDASDMARREASLAQVNLREPLAQLKNACAMLAVNSERVYALLDVDVGRNGSAPASVLVAKSVQPVLLEVLQPISQSLAAFAMAHLNAIAMDGGSALRDPAASAEAVQAATTHLARLLRQFVTAMKTLGEIYLPAAAAAGSPQAGASDAVHLYANKVHEVACGVVRACWSEMQSRATQGPEPAVLKACVPLPVTNTSVLSSLPGGDEASTQRLAFVLTRFLYASLAQCTATALRSNLVSEDGVPGVLMSPLTAGLEGTAQQLQHRGIVLLGQLEVRAVYDAAFSGHSSSAAARAAAPASPTVPEALLRLLPEWSSVYDALKVLPPVTIAVSTAGSGGKVAGPASAQLGRRRDANIGFGYRPGAGSSVGAYGEGDGTGGSSTGTRSDHRGGGGSSALPRGGVGAAASGGGGAGGKPAVAYTRQVMSTLQVSVNHIFANAETSLRTDPLSNQPSALMACVVRYLLQGIVDAVRDEASYTEAAFQQLQLSCTFLLHALVAPAKGTASRQWRKEWADEDMRDVQRLLDEVCTCAYDKYEAKVPLSTAVLDRIVEVAVRGGRSALATAAAVSPTDVPELQGASHAAVFATAPPSDLPQLTPAPTLTPQEIRAPPTTTSAAAPSPPPPPSPQPVQQPTRPQHDDPLQSPSIAARQQPQQQQPPPAARVEVAAAAPPPPPQAPQQQQQQPKPAPAAAMPAPTPTPATTTLPLPPPAPALQQRQPHGAVCRGG